MGAQYEGKDWNWETVRELAKKLTVDADGNDATSDKFDAANIVQYGLDAQCTENDARAWSTDLRWLRLGRRGRRQDRPVAGQLARQASSSGTTASGTDHFIPSKAEVDGITGSMADGNTFQSGQIAMDIVHQWYTCCVYPGRRRSRP